MAGLIYLLDTNVISDRINGIGKVTSRLTTAIQQGDLVYICPPVHYEVLRGLIRTGSTRKRQIYEEALVPSLDWIDLITEDWLQAAKLWSDAVKRGRQLSDVDLLVAAISIRLNAVIVGADNDFDVLPIRREDWRE